MLGAECRKNRMPNEILTTVPKCRNAESHDCRIVLNSADADWSCECCGKSIEITLNTARSYNQMADPEGE